MLSSNNQSVGTLKRTFCTAVVVASLFYWPFIRYADSYDKNALIAELLNAELFCFSLESAVFEFKEDFNSRSDVYDFFRQGFGHSLSEKLTENIWAKDRIMLKPGDEIMKTPDGIEFKSISKNTAIISFKTPEGRKHIWGSSEYTELIMKKEGDRWKLFEK